MIVHRMDNRSYAGTCRNWSLDNTPDPTYDLFLDSDDEFVDQDTLQKIHDYIVEKNFPDVVKCSFNLIDHRTRPTKIIRKDFNCDYGDMVRYNAPWTYAVSSRIKSKFSENQKKFNDVMWSIRIMDKAESFSVFNTPTVNYHVGENQLSLQFGKDSYDYDSIRSYFQTIKELQEMQPRNEYIGRQVEILLKNKQIELQRLMNTKSLENTIQKLIGEFKWKKRT